MVLVSMKQRYVRLSNRFSFCNTGIKHNPSFLKIKLITLQTLLTILNTTKSTEISGVIKGLSLDTQDTLMKYLYKGMGLPGWGDISGSVLLGWHEKVSIPFVDCRMSGNMERDANYYPSLFLLFILLQLTEAAGVGCIVRAMTDRRIV